jgi:hypothetical protein
MKRNYDGKKCNKQLKDSKDIHGPMSEVYSRFFLARIKKKKSSYRLTIQAEKK